MQYLRSSRASKPEPSLPEALTELRELLVAREVTVVPPPGESHTALLTRFLVARKLTVSKAALASLLRHYESVSLEIYVLSCLGGFSCWSLRYGRRRGGLLRQAGAPAALGRLADGWRAQC